MDDLIPTRCPRCLTDGQAPADLDRLLCPVCSAVLVRLGCPECGQRHVIEEGTTAVDCPVTGVHLQVIGDELARSAAPTPPPAAPTPPPPSAAPPIVSGPPPLPDAPLEAPPRQNRRSLLIVGTAFVVLVVVAVVVLLVARSGGEEEGTLSVSDIVKQELDASDQNAQTACQAVRSFATNRDTLAQLLEQMPAAGKDSLVATMRTQGGSWLPPESADWGFDEIRTALLTLWDECDERGI